MEKIESGWQEEDVPFDSGCVRVSKAGSYFVGRKR